MKRKTLLFALIGALFLSCFVIFCNVSIKHFDKTVIVEDTSMLPHMDVALVLGTSKYVVGGGVNEFYQNRIDAAVELFEKGVVDYLLVSGDNRKRNYNEPQTMKNDLVKRGIPKESIVLDFAGFRTLDSVVRSKKVFQQNNIIIISQRFHLERALFLAYHNDMNAIGYAAKDLVLHRSIKVLVRETLARVKVFYDLLAGVQPHFLGDPIPIPQREIEPIKLKADSLLSDQDLQSLLD